MSLAQVERADRHIFSVIAERAMHGLQTVGGVQPMKTALEAAMLDHELFFLPSHAVAEASVSILEASGLH